jgi:hypothetical protein
MRRPAACRSLARRAQLNSLAALGFHYLEIRRFIQAEQYAVPGNAYCNALCSGLSGVLPSGALLGCRPQASQPASQRQRVLAEGGTQRSQSPLTELAPAEQQPARPRACLPAACRCSVSSVPSVAGTALVVHGAGAGSSAAP